MLPSEPITTVPISAFLGMTACAVALNILTVIFIRKAHKYKKLLEQYQNQSSGIKCHSAAKPNNSIKTTTIDTNQSKGKDKF